MIPAPVVVARSTRIVVEVKNNLSSEVGTGYGFDFAWVICRIFIWKEVRRLLIEEYRPEINNLKQKLDEMRGSL